VDSFADVARFVPAPAGAAAATSDGDLPSEFLPWSALCEIFLVTKIFVDAMYAAREKGFKTKIVLRVGESAGRRLLTAAQGLVDALAEGARGKVRRLGAMLIGGVSPAHVHNTSLEHKC
jgi:hypothetical protein